MKDWIWPRTWSQWQLTYYQSALSISRPNDTAPTHDAGTVLHDMQSQPCAAFFTGLDTDTVIAHAERQNRLLVL